MPAKSQPLVIDIYHGDPVLDFAKTAASGVKGVIHKATQGGGIVDQSYATRRKMALAAGLKWGAYHFFDFTASPVVQATHFLSVADVDDQTLVAFDWENVGSREPSAVLAKQFLEAIEIALGRKAVRELIAMQPGEVLETFADVDDLMKEVGFVPAIPIEEGIRRFVVWYREYHRG